MTGDFRAAGGRSILWCRRMEDLEGKAWRASWRTKMTSKRCSLIRGPIDRGHPGGAQSARDPGSGWEDGTVPGGARKTCCRAGWALVGDRGGQPLWEGEQRKWLEERGVKTRVADLLDRGSTDRLPEAGDVLYLVGLKFGTQENPSQTWRSIRWRRFMSRSAIAEGASWPSRPQCLPAHAGEGRRID